MSGVPVWLQPSGLVYQIAFDRCVMLAQPHKGSAWLLASNPFYARELLRRWSSPVTLCPIGGWNQKIGLPEVVGQDIVWQQVQVVAPESLSIPASVKTIIWAEPTKSDWQLQMTWLLDHLGSENRLIILGRTAGLRRFLPEQPEQVGEPAYLSALMAMLQRQEPQRPYITYGFHAPLSLLGGIMARIPVIMKRDDLVDRVLAFVRRYIVCQGRQALRSPVWMLVIHPHKFP
jgi:hypothetical protein